MNSRFIVWAALLASTVIIPMAEAKTAAHSADYSPPYGQISLSELLRVIQFYNTGALHCMPDTEDGYAPGTGDTSCHPHDSDYNPQNWSTSISELLRLIQYFNYSAYHVDCSSEDGFAPGPGSLEPCEGEAEGEGEPEGEGQAEGEAEGEGEGEGEPEGEAEGEGEGEGEPEGEAEGEGEGEPEGEGQAEGEAEGEGEGEGEPEGEAEGEAEGEGEPEGEAEGEGEGEGEPEGEAEGEGEPEGEGEGGGEGEGEGEEPIYLIGYRDIVFVDASRNNRQVDIRVYYPATESGTNKPVAGAPGVQFPVVVMGHGYQISTTSYDYLWQSLATRGYFFVLPKTESGLFPSHGEFARDLAFVADVMQAEGARADSPFWGKVRNATAVMGHSMGGGAAVLSVQYSANIHALVPIAAAETNPSAIAASANVLIPALLLAGASDCVTPPASNQTPMYNNMPTSCKYLVSITQGSHCQFAQNASLCNLAESFACPFRSYISASLQRSITLSVLEPWLDFILKERDSAWEQYQEHLETLTGLARISAVGACGE